MRHEKICASQKQRKKFDSSKKRLADLSSDPAVKRKPSPPPSISKVFDIFLHSKIFCLFVAIGASHFAASLRHSNYLFSLFSNISFLL